MPDDKCGTVTDFPKKAEPGSARAVLGKLALDIDDIEDVIVLVGTKEGHAAAYHSNMSLPSYAYLLEVGRFQLMDYMASPADAEEGDTH